MGMGASLMLGWTVLLLWAYRQPLERRWVALFTMIVLVGIMSTEIFALGQGYHRPAFSLGFQAVFLGLYGYCLVTTRKI
jgi:hypothetical protein